jgi:Concanavalin A-like lectin/glucanases superfamily
MKKTVVNRFNRTSFAKKIILPLLTAIALPIMAGKMVWQNNFDRTKDFYSSSGNLRFKSVGNIKFVSNTGGKAVLFAEKGSYLEALPLSGNPLNPEAASFCISFKIRSTVETKKTVIILFKGGGSVKQAGYSVILTPKGTLRFDVSDGKKKIIATGDLPLDDKWHKVKLFCDRSGIFNSKNRIWVKIDKKKFRSRSFSGTLPLNYPKPLTLGGCGKAYSFKGMLDDLRIEIYQPIEDVFAKIPSSELIGQKDISGGGIALQFNKFGNFSKITARGKSQTFTNAGGLEFRECTNGTKNVFQRVKLSEQNDGKYSYSAQNNDLKFSVQATPEKNYIKFRLTAENLTGKDRALSIRYTIPLKTDNYAIYYDFNRKITKLPLPLNTFETMVPSGGVGDHGKRSVYPFCTVESQGLPVSLAVPIDKPRVINFELNEHGISIIFSIGISDTAKKTGRKVDMEFWVYAHNPEWGFRSTANLYQKLQPDYFEVRAKNYGAWLCGLPAHKTNKNLTVANSKHKVSDYFQYILLFAPPSRAIMAKERALGKDVFYYAAIAHLKIRWRKGPHAEKVTNKEAINFLRTGKYEAFAPVNWGFNLPNGHKQVYAAGVNSFLYEADGKISGCWSKHIPAQGIDMRSPNVSMDPDLYDNKKPIAATQFINFFLETCRKTPELGGFYMDWFSTMGATRNFRSKHFAYADYPLTFATDNGRVCQLNIFTEIEFARKLHKLFKDKSSPAYGKLLWANDVKIFSGGTAFLIPLIDVIGFEWPVRDEPNNTCFDFFHAMSGKKPINMTCNHNLKLNARYRRLIPIFYERLAALGIPAVIRKSAGNDDFAKFCAPYVDKYVPLATDLQKMGYEIITAAKSNNADLLLERFGDLTDGTIVITAFNRNKKSAASGTIRILKKYLPKLEKHKLTAINMLTGEKIPLKNNSKEIKFKVNLKSEKATFIKLQTN